MSDNGVQLHMSDRQILEAEEVSRAELEGTIGLERIATHKLKAQLTALREALTAIANNPNPPTYWCRDIAKAALLNGNNPTTKEK